MQTFLSPAKLNLFLHIVGRRPDGYHELQTLFQLIDYHDKLQFEINQTGRIHLVTQDPVTLHIEDNLILKAANLLKTLYHTPCGCTVILRKNIPIGGGLGGGSSNAATALLVLNQLWQLKIPRTELECIGRQLGADVPLFVRGVSSLGEGVGEVLTPVELPKRWYLVLVPPCTVSTHAIFSHEGLTRNTKRMTIHASYQVSDTGQNDCTPVVTQLYPPVRDALEWLSRFGDARLTGTGACVYAAFPTEHAARTVEKLIKLPLQGFVAQGLQNSLLHQQLEKIG